MTLRWVKKRDGRRVPFDPRKLASSIQAAARAAGEEDILADELAEVVALFLEREWQERIPATSELEDLVERVLLETAHARTAAVYAERVKVRDRKRAEIVVVREDAPPVGPDGELLPAPPPEPWNEGKIVAALQHRLKLAPEIAEEVASAAEQRVFALGLARVPASLIRDVVDAELAERGFSARLGRPGEIRIPTEEVRRLILQSSVRRSAGAVEPIAGGAEAAVGVDVLTRFALDAIYPEHVAEASREGRIHIQDIGRPLRLTAGAVSLLAVKVCAGRDGPRTASEAGLALARALEAAGRTHARAVGVPYANVFLAPFVRGKDAAVRREVREFLRHTRAVGDGPRRLLHVGPAPERIAGLAVVGPGGRRWKARYGELRAEADRAARLLVEIAAEEAARGLPVPEIVVEVADASALDLLRGNAAAVVRGGAVEVARGLAEGADLADALIRGGGLVAAGAAQVVAVNCAAAAYRAGRGDDPAFRRELDAALDLAMEAIRAKWAFLEAGLYRPPLPLWEGGSTAAPAGRAARAPQPVMVAAARAVHVIGLVGLDEAYVFLTGEPPAHNPAVARLAGEAIAALAERARREGARHGLQVRIEEPPLEWASRRLADVDLRSTPAASEVLGLERAANEVRYSTGFGAHPALADVIYRPLGIAPFIPAGEGTRARAQAFLEALSLPPPAFVPPPPDPARARAGAVA